VVVPAYNHASSLATVVRGVLRVHPDVLVVNDGSTDLPFLSFSSPGQAEEPDVPPAGHPLHGLPVSYISHRENMGKGTAILTAATEASRLCMTHIITIDADGQHDPRDIPAFLEAARQDPLAIYVGTRDFGTENVPFSSRFGRAFSNFWFKVQTGEATGDMQSGFRLYPLTVLQAIRCTEPRYSFEIEVLVRSSWAGFAVKNLPIRVYYQNCEDRVSHFKPLTDNLRISLLNTRLTIRAIMPLPHKKYTADGDGNINALHPLRSLRLLLANNATPKNLSLSASVGMGIGTLPLVGLHSILILLATGALRLNKITGLAVSQLCMPPLVPALCVEAGYYLRHESLLTDISLRTLGYEALDRIWEWILGSLMLAPALALLMGGLVYCLAKGVQKGMAAGATQTSPTDPEGSM
jgi:glycosyltransferase involved in cell wall biosynthesis